MTQIHRIELDLRDYGVSDSKESLPSLSGIAV
jgi:hypothetical protein